MAGSPARAGQTTTFGFLASWSGSNSPPAASCVAE